MALTLLAYGWIAYDADVRRADLGIGRYAWSELRCGCGRQASHLEGGFARLAGADAEFDAGALEGHVFSETVLYEPAPVVISACLDALADDLAVTARLHLLALLAQLSSAQDQPPGVTNAGSNLWSECRAALRKGIPLLYAEVFRAYPKQAGRENAMVAASYAFDVLMMIDNDAQRVERCRSAAAEFLAWDLRSKASFGGSASS
ncbi:hypothetical protein [Paractinoplanes toevensis]|uniref:Uncharacterized protein n=1 Tax=Paractinoplanes toevensis TaxID=571911 RepID=A0A920BR88_9ACTN|nr:hypothetical protein [Actinoplanes toevensis]GIM97815.1 hypothetical protein Ato02nite_096080 [Actinoplanes toevensis]